MRMLELNENIGAYMLATLVVASLTLFFVVILISPDTPTEMEPVKPECDLCCTTYTGDNVVSFHCTKTGEPLKIGEKS